MQFWKGLYDELGFVFAEFFLLIRDINMKPMYLTPTRW